MLLSLHVKNFAIIDEVEIEFKDHLNILTGETGAGKSILLGSINVALGGKVSKEMIRNNAEYALVELLFETDDTEVFNKLKESDIVMEDNQILISRKIMVNGRNISKINGETVTTAIVKEIAAWLLDIHGQHEHQSLLHKQKHLEFIDRYAKDETEQLKVFIVKEYQEYLRYTKELENSAIDEDKKIREISFLEYEINEIEAARLITGEDEELQGSYKRLANANHIREGMAEIYQYTAESDSSAAYCVGKALRQIVKLVEYDSGLDDYMMQMTRIESLLNDLNRSISEYAADMEDSDEEFAETEQRLNLINHLKSKYGNSIEEILAYMKNGKERIQKLKDYDDYLEDIKNKIKTSGDKLSKYSQKLSDIRKKKAKQLTKKMTEALIELNFLDVKFDMVFHKMDHFTANGYDDAEFIISTNPGEPLQPLSKVASGGELSRIMLAMKSVLADKDEIGTLIFDEIDVGVSGRTAQKVSEKLAVIAKKHQVLCITHLPQLAAMSDSHYRIEKSTDGISTKTDIIALNYKESVNELARILGGVEITPHVIKNAEEMKELANMVKNNLK